MNTPMNQRLIKANLALFGTILEEYFEDLMFPEEDEYTHGQQPFEDGYNLIDGEIDTTSVKMEKI